MDKWDEFLENPENLQFPFLDLIKEEMEVHGASAQGLLIWLRERTTLENDTDGIRVGRCLHRFGPIDFGFAARDITRCGMPCNARQVRRWWGKLARLGKVAGVRTGRGYLMVVMYSRKKWKDGEANIRKLRPGDWRIRAEVLKAAEIRRHVRMTSDRRAEASVECGNETDHQGAIRLPARGRSKENY